jgi:adenylylsulfate kinase
MAWVAWLTGLPGSGKSSIAREAARQLEADGTPVRVLELDEIRRVVTPSPRYTAEERDLLYRALAYMAMLLSLEGVNVIIDATAHKQRFRDAGRSLVSQFAEVHLAASLECCRARARERYGGFAPPDVYSLAGHPGSTVPGVDEVYEAPQHPELMIDTEHLSVAEAAGRLVGFLETLRGGREPCVRQVGGVVSERTTGRKERGGSCCESRTG